MDMLRNKMRKKLQRRTRPMEMETSKTRLARKATMKMQRMKMVKYIRCPTY